MAYFVFDEMKIEVGKILKPQGIKGELKISCFLDDSSMLKDVKQLYIGLKAYTVKSLRCCGNIFYALLTDVEDRNTAESLKNCVVLAEKDDVTVLDGRYFIEDLIGCRVVQDNQTLGEVIEVLQYGAADVFVCNGERGGFSFPFLKTVVSDVNVQCRRITVDKTRFQEVVVYDD